MNVSVETIDSARTAMSTAAPDRIPRRVWHLAWVIVFGAFASQLDTSVVNVGLRSITSDLGAGLERVQWVSTAYLIALAVTLPIGGWLGRKVGVGRLWLWSLAAFTVASGLCALAPTVDWLIALRVVRGLTAGLLVPAGQTILGQAVGPHRLGRVMATLGIAVSLAPAVGPIVGALVLDAVSWRWLFVINLPIGAAGLALGTRLIPRGEAEAAPRLDWSGLALISLGLPPVVYALTSLGEHATVATPSVLVPLLVGVLGLLAFGLRARRHEHPLLDLKLFRNPVYAAASSAAAFTGAALFGAALLYPLYFQILRGQSVLATGLSLISFGLGTVLILPFAGRLTDRYGGGIVSVAGNVLTIATTLPFAVLSAHADSSGVQILLLARGMGIALAVMPAVTAAYAAVTPAQLPDATTQVNILQRVGGAVGGAVFTVIVAQGLPAGAEHAFHTAFWWLTGASIMALTSALWLWSADRASSAARTTRSSPSQPNQTSPTQEESHS